MVEKFVQLFVILVLVIPASWFFLGKAWVSGKVGKATSFFLFYLNVVWIAVGQKDDDFKYLNSASTSTRSSTSSTVVETLMAWSSSSTWSSALCWVIFFVILAFVALMQPRRWNRRHSQEELESGINERGGDQVGEPLPRGEIRDRLHDWMEYVMIPQLFSSSRSSTDPNGTGRTAHSQSSSSSVSATIRQLRTLVSLFVCLQQLVLDQRQGEVRVNNVVPTNLNGKLPRLPNPWFSLGLRSQGRRTIVPPVEWSRSGGMRSREP